MTTPEQPEQIDREETCPCCGAPCEVSTIMPRAVIRQDGDGVYYTAYTHGEKMYHHRRLGIEQGKRMKQSTSVAFTYGYETGLVDGKRLAGEWQDIATFEDRDGPIVLWGKLFAHDYTPEEIAKEKPRAVLLSYTYEDNGERRYASTETYYGSETWYVLPTHWMPLPSPPLTEQQEEG